MSVGAEDASRDDEDFPQTVIDAVAANGAWRFRFADTLGVLDPFSTQATFQRLRARTDLPGVPRAATILASPLPTRWPPCGGAKHASVGVLDLGERAGNAVLEHVAAAIPRLGSVRQ